jgi:hypothetical protein
MTLPGKHWVANASPKYVFQFDCNQWRLIMCDYTRLPEWPQEFGHAETLGHARTLPELIRALPAAFPKHGQ